MGITWLGAELSVDVAIVVIELDCVLFDFWDQRWLKCTLVHQYIDCKYYFILVSIKKEMLYKIIEFLNIRIIFTSEITFRR